MVTILTKARALLTVYYAMMVEYRAELVLWALAGVLPFIMMGVWMQAGAAAGSRLGATPEDYARYFLFVFIVRQLTVVWVIWEFEYNVVQGRLSPYLLQPMDVVWRFVAMHLSEQAARLPFGLLVLGAFFLIYPSVFLNWQPSLAGLLLAPVVIYAAFALRFLLQYSVALLAFWIERVAAIEQVMFLGYLFLSGTVARLDDFDPPLLRTLALCTPFPYVLYFPVQLLLGHVAAPGGVALPVWLAGLAAWMLLFALLNRWLWRRGLRQYSAMGA